MHFYFYKTIFETHLFNMNKRYLSAFCLSVAVSLASVIPAFAQGDSDPGMGTVGAMRMGTSLQVTDEEYEFQKTHFALSTNFAKGEQGVKLVMPGLDIRVPVQDFGYFDVKLPFKAAAGDLGHIWGVGDLTFAYTHVLHQMESDWILQLTAGGLFGMGTANFTKGGTRPLPMIYQSNLGSTDAMVGASISWKQYLTIAAGYQQPVFRYNENEYYRLGVTNDPVYSNSNYVVAPKLYRNGDVMFSIEGRFSGKRAGISASPVVFYHLRNDLYTDRAGLNREIYGSRGFTMNLGGNAFVRFGRYASYKLDLSAGVPLIQRNTVADGLTRQWYIMPRFTYFFNQTTLLFR